jgi:ubiquinone biosynthesis protein UbiJ
MATQSPFSFVEGVIEQVASRLSPPLWMVHEAQHRLVLLLNHVLQQEPEALARLKRQSGRVALVQWRTLTLQLAATPAGLLELASQDAVPDLTLAVTQTSPFELAQQAMAGEKPEVRIEGDVQLAAELNWLVDHVRWDIEEDLSKIVGDVAAHRLGEVGRSVASALRRFLASGPVSTLAQKAAASRAAS